MFCFTGTSLILRELSALQAANGGEDTPGIIPRFCAKLLDGSPVVAGMLRPKEYAMSFPTGRPPNFVRVVQYDYRFSSMRARWTRGAG